MRKFIHSNFEIDLSKLKITDNAENPWLTDNYFTKYSYPFELPLTEEIDQAFGFISDHNSANSQTIFEGIYVHGNTMEAAVLEVEECERSLSVTMRYGFDDFPSFGKKLSELSLQQLEVANIYQHAKQVISLGWPTVNYNFPQIHIDKINPEDEQWNAFEKIINNYKNGEFLENEVLADENVSIAYNRNIIQPVPHALHVLQRGIADAGFTLHGDVLEDPLMKKTYIYADAEYYTSLAPESIDIIVPATEYTTMYFSHVGSGYNIYGMTLQKQVNFEHPGRYRIIGQATVTPITHGKPAVIIIKYRNTILFSHTIHLPQNQNSAAYYIVPIDVAFDTMLDLNPHYLTLYAESRYHDFRITFELALNPIRFHDLSGEVIPTIINENRVDLRRAVPDKTFGDFAKALFILKRFGFSIRGKQIWMNYIDNELNRRDVIDLSAYDVRYPKKKYNKGNSFLLKYSDVQSDVYTFAHVFQNKDGSAQAGYTTNEKTKEIVVDALPLPLKVIDGLQTAHGFLDDKSKLMFVVYDGLTDGKNLAKDPSPWSIPVLHEQHYKNWFAARIDGQSYTWTFIDTYERLISLNEKSTVFAFGNNLLCKTLQKTEIAPDLFEIEIETELLV